jgi:hypothetical protein
MSKVILLKWSFVKNFILERLPVLEVLLKNSISNESGGDQLDWMEWEAEMFDSLEFPEAPSFKAEWKPIYFEPIVNSGEKIVILIVVKIIMN